MRLRTTTTTSADRHATPLHLNAQALQYLEKTASSGDGETPFSASRAIAAIKQDRVRQIQSHTGCTDGEARGALKRTDALYARARGSGSHSAIIGSLTIYVPTLRLAQET